MAAKVRFRNFMKSFEQMKYKIFYCLIICICSCSMKHSTIQAPDSSFDWQGHRGCRGLMPENTIPAMIKAIDLGVTTIEMDVVISKDRQVVVSHEPFMSAEIATAPDGRFPTFQDQRTNNLYLMDYADIKLWDVGLRQLARFPRQYKMKAYKPLLSEVMDSVELHLKNNQRKPVQYSIEIKSGLSTDDTYHPKPDEFVQLVMDVIISKHINDRIIIQSFDYRVLQVLQQKFRHIKTSFLIEGNKRSPEQQLDLLGFTPSVYSPEYHLVDSQTVSFCHKKNMKLIPWTVNELSAMEKLKTLGVDGIITDYPDLIMKN
jgi:glycerophosphoryl diester phosphodiesterase